MVPGTGRRSSGGEFFGGVGPDFAQGGVVVGDFEELGGGGVVAQGDDDFVDEFGGVGSDNGAAEEFAGLAVGDEFDEAVGLAVDHGFAVVVEGVRGGGEIEAEFGGFALGQSDHGGFGLGEDGEEAQAVVDRLEFVVAAQQAGGVAGGDFALLDGDVDDLEFAGHVTGAENFRDRGLLRVAGGKGAPGGDVESGRGEVESGGGGVASEGEEDFVRLECFLAVIVRHADPFAARGSAGADDAATGDELGAVAFHAPLHGVRNVIIHRAEDVFAALDDGDFGAEGAVVMGHFQRDRAGAEDEEGSGRVLVVEDVVAGQRPGLGQAGDVGVADDRTGGHEEGFGAEGLLTAAAQAHDGFVGRSEAGVSADQLEFSAFQLLRAVFGEFGDEAALAFDDFGAVETDVAGPQAEFRGFAHFLQAVGRLDERFARHASAQDAEAAEFVGSVDDGGAQSLVRGGAGRGVTGAAAADHDKIKLTHPGLCRRGRSGWRTPVRERMGYRVRGPSVR